MPRIYNFSPGPAMLPTEVLQQAQKELLDWHDTGMSIMEVSHRGKQFAQIIEESQLDLRDILNIPDNYKILFLQGGSRSQFAMVPMNLAAQNKKVAYVQTGIWGTHAAKEAQRFCDVNLVANAEDSGFTTIPEQDTWQSFDDAAYLHYVDNETVNGVEFPYVPDSKVPLVSDMSSNLLSRPVDVSKFGIIYACAQKNIGPAGVTVVIIRNDLLECEPLEQTPSMFRYKLHADANSVYNTAPTFAWYLSGLVFKWVKQQGGVKALAEINQRKAKKLYDFIDSSDFYINKVDPHYRSTMNVVFQLNDESLNDKFLVESEKVGLVNLKGHRFVGGMRASIYNAMPEAGVDALIHFMGSFSR